MVVKFSILYKWTQQKQILEDTTNSRGFPFTQDEKRASETHTQSHGRRQQCKGVCGQAWPPPPPKRT